MTFRKKNSYKMKLKGKLIKLLGGYTYGEYKELESKYASLLYKDTSYKEVQMVNENLYKMLRQLEDFARNRLYNIDVEEWCDRMWNVIHNNKIRMILHYNANKKPVIFTLNVGLDKKDNSTKEELISEYDV